MQNAKCKVHAKCKMKAEDAKELVCGVCILNFAF
jgi:hypothetical protein